MRNMITYTGKDLLLFPHKELILFHDSHYKVYFATSRSNTLKVPNNIKKEKFETFLQLAHGVQLKLDDSHNGICKTRKVSETIANGCCHAEWPIKINDFYCGIYLQYRVNQKSLSSVAIVTGSELSESAKIPPKTPVFLNVLSGNPKFQNKFKVETFAKGNKPVGVLEIPISEVLNSKNGFLDENGTMTIEYGFHFDGIFDENQEIWKFNLKSKIFDCEPKKNMISYKGKELLFSHKQLILFHDSILKIYNEKNIIDILETPRTIEMDCFEKVLQIAHGVQLKLDGEDLLSVIRIAHRYGIQNVLKYCERQFIMKFSEFPGEEISKVFWKHLHRSSICELIRDSANFNLNRLLVFFLAVFSKNEKYDKRALFFEQICLDRMTNESMKIVVAHFLYGN